MEPAGCSSGPPAALHMSRNRRKLSPWRRRPSPAPRSIQQPSPSSRVKIVGRGSLVGTKSQIASTLRSLMEFPAGVHVATPLDSSSMMCIQVQTSAPRLRQTVGMCEVVSTPLRQLRTSKTLYEFIPASPGPAPSFPSGTAPTAPAARHRFNLLFLPSSVQPHMLQIVKSAGGSHTSRQPLASSSYQLSRRHPPIRVPLHSTNRLVA